MDDDQRTDPDKVLSGEIMEASDPNRVARLVYEYYRDKSRADRTPRSAMYLHLGLLTAAVFRCTGGTVQRPR